jgi:hypothetical protein
MDANLTRIHAVLSTTPLRWFSLATSLPEALLTTRPAPNEWSAVDCLQHIVDTERWVFPVRIRAFLAGQDFADFDPEAQDRSGGARKPADLAAEFAQLRQESLGLFLTLVPADLPRTARHSELGIVTLEAMLNEWAGHDLMHTVQAERSVMQPFISSCGAWRQYFADHDVAHSRS